MELGLTSVAVPSAALVNSMSLSFHRLAFEVVTAYETRIVLFVVELPVGAIMYVFVATGVMAVDERGTA